MQLTIHCLDRPIGGFRIARKNRPSFEAGSQPKAEMKDLKNQRADLRKQIQLMR